MNKLPPELLFELLDTTTTISPAALIALASTTPSLRQVYKAKEWHLLEDSVRHSLGPWPFEGIRLLTALLDDAKKKSAAEGSSVTRLAELMRTIEAEEESLSIPEALDMVRVCQTASSALSVVSAFLVGVSKAFKRSAFLMSLCINLTASGPDESGYEDDSVVTAQSLPNDINQMLRRMCNYGERRTKSTASILRFSIRKQSLWDYSETAELYMGTFVWIVSPGFPPRLIIRIIFTPSEDESCELV